MNDETAANTDTGEEADLARNNTASTSTKVTIAFPFSHLEVHEPSDSLIELARILADVADHVATTAPSPETEATARSAAALLLRLRG